MLPVMVVRVWSQILTRRVDGKERIGVQMRVRRNEVRRGPHDHRPVDEVESADVKPSVEL